MVITKASYVLIKRVLFLWSAVIAHTVSVVLLFEGLWTTGA